MVSLAVVSGVASQRTTGVPTSSAVDQIHRGLQRDADLPLSRTRTKHLLPLGF
jgi:hypothetical protein